ncbi:MAG: prolyl oligopeptidase family serine peptidase [Polyangiaceae bacterium]|nr:prolyl oligopeptidase family serine peptidase [Polyangiaceae bacterium]
MRVTIVLSFLSISVFSFIACGGNDTADDSESTQDDSDASSVDNASSSSSDTGSSGRRDSGADANGGTTSGDVGPPPSGTCTVTKDKNGFFTRNSSLGSYVAYVPASYSPNTPMRLIVGLHGCGDDALNFAHWAINPNTATQQYIGISVDGATSPDGEGCWDVGNDDPKVLAAVDDISKCYWVDQSRITIAGYSSGGILAYSVGLQNASRFAGILIEDSGLYPLDEDTLLANAWWETPDCKYHSRSRLGLSARSGASRLGQDHGGRLSAGEQDCFWHA